MTTSIAPGLHNLTRHKRLAGITDTGGVGTDADDLCMIAQVKLSGLDDLHAARALLDQTRQR